MGIVLAKASQPFQGDDQVRARAMQVVSSLAVLGGLAWIATVLVAFSGALAQVFPVTENGVHIGNLEIKEYSTTPDGAVMIASFNGNIGALNFIQYVLNTGAASPPNRADGTRVNVPWVDPPRGGYEGLNLDNLPFYDFAFRSGNNRIFMNDFPGGANSSDFVTHLVRVSGMNIRPLFCFRWGYTTINGNIVLTPPAITPVNYDNNLTNVLRDEFPGWNISFFASIPTLSTIGLVVMAAFLAIAYRVIFKHHPQKAER